MLNVISLCSGIGGLDLGIRLAVPSARTICWVEREAYVAARLVERMRGGILDTAPVHSDLATFDGRQWSGVVDLVTAGFPCQPFSVAGKGLAAEDPRHLWPHVLRVFQQSQASLMFFENVRGLVSRGLRQVLSEVAELGADAEWDVFSAAEAGANHQRDRIFCLIATPEGKRILADPDRVSRREGRASDSQERPGRRNAHRSGERPGKVGHADNAGRCKQRWVGANEEKQPTAECPNWWASEPRLGRVAHGVADRAHRLRACGNGVVPAVAALAWRELAGRMVESSNGDTTEEAAACRGRLT